MWREEPVIQVCHGLATAYSAEYDMAALMHGPMDIATSHWASATQPV